MKIEFANEKDKNEILALYKTMLFGPADWNENYPELDTIEFDLSRDALIKLVDDAGKIAAVISIDEDEEVDALPCWSRELRPFGELSRLCVRKDMQGRGLSKLMMRHGFDELKKRGMKGIHILVKTGHGKAIRCYSELGFKTVGECHLFEKDFICMEMRL